MSATKISTRISLACLTIGLLSVFAIRSFGEDKPVTEEKPGTGEKSSETDSKGNSAANTRTTTGSAPVVHTLANSSVQKATEKSGCLVDKTAIEDIKKLREANEIKQRDLTAKENELKAREAALSEELKKIEQVRDSISQIQTNKKKEDEAKVAKLVETFLTMSPRAASKILATLDDGLAVAVLSEMETQRLAKIMNLMDPLRSSKLSEMMAGIARSGKISQRGGVK